MPAGTPIAIFSEEGRHGDRQGRRHALEHELDRRPAVAHGVAEIAGQGMADIGEVLHPDRLVEAPGLAERLDRFRRRVDRHDEQRRIARKPQHEEGEGHHQEDGQQGAQQPSGEIAQHQAALAAICSARWQATCRPSASVTQCRRFARGSARRRSGSARGRRSPPARRSGWAGRPSGSAAAGRCDALPESPTPAPACRDAPARRTVGRDRRARRCGRDTSPPPRG